MFYNDYNRKLSGSKGVAFMKHKVKMLVETQKKGVFGAKTVREYKTVKVDGKTYKQMKKQAKSAPFSLDEMLLYDTVFED